MTRWMTYREFWYAEDNATLHAADVNKIADIAAYMKQNPSVQIGIDGTMDPNGSDPRNQDLADRRVESVRSALIAAGVQASRIKTGSFGDTRFRRDRRVELLVLTDTLPVAAPTPTATR